MTKDSLPGPVSPKPDTTEVARAIRSFADFDHWMDGQLEQLVARWIHTAAPNAGRAWRLGRGLRRR
jgi:hypothetical protein